MSNDATRHSYQAFGLDICSELALPELATTNNGIGPSEKEGNSVFIRRGRVPRMKGTVPENGSFYATTRQVIYAVPGIGYFQVRGGRDIIVDPAEEVEEAAIRLYVLGISLATILHQQGLLVLHASGVAIHGRAVLFLGQKGAGKSTMAAQLHQNGHLLITDDVAAVDVVQGHDPIVYPGFAQLKLWPESATAVGRDSESLPRLYGDVEKRIDRPDGPMAIEALPLSTIYVLDEGEKISIDPIRSGRAFEQLMRHSFLSKILHASGQHPLQFQRCVHAINSGISVLHLKRPKKLHRLRDVAQYVESHERGAS